MSEFARLNATGQAGLMRDGVGAQLVAAYGREDQLIRIAAQIEQASPWAERWPSLDGEAVGA